MYVLWVTVRCCGGGDAGSAGSQQKSYQALSECVAKRIPEKEQNLL
jgi:hypothetical protein